jgi:predicted dehydrogenase
MATRRISRCSPVPTGNRLRPDLPPRRFAGAHRPRYASASSERATTQPRCCSLTYGTIPRWSSVATTNALSGLNAQRKFGFATITTDVESVLDDESLDAVFIVTRHQSHAGFVCQALERGLTVFVEKPLALTEDQLSTVLATVDRTGNNRIMVGFNRRFAPLIADLQQRLGRSRGPVSARYLVNAGRLDRASWYLNSELEGSRFVGEGGHFIDTLSALVGHPPVEVQAMGTGANVHAMLRFADDSVATISYVIDGSSRFPKETLDVTGDGRNGRLDNFQRVTVWSASGKSGRRVLGQDKGQRGQLERFVHAVRTGASMPIPLESLVATTRATLAVETSLSSQKPVAW